MHVVMMDFLKLWCLIIEYGCCFLFFFSLHCLEQNSYHGLEPSLDFTIIWRQNNSLNVFLRILIGFILFLLIS
jgi:hypothetical protein